MREFEESHRKCWWKLGIKSAPHLRRHVRETDHADCLLVVKGEGEETLPCERHLGLSLRKLLLVVLGGLEPSPPSLTRGKTSI